MSTEVQCYKCNHQMEFSVHSTVQRSDSCEKCLTDLRCCKMCQFYDTNSYNECRETSAARIVDKEKANFCDYFQLATGKNYSEVKKDHLSAAEALFKK